MSEPNVYVGIDGGGTRSRALALDQEGRELGRAEGPGSLVRDGAPSAAVAVVAALTRDVAAAARVPLPVRRLAVGLAGAGRAAGREPVEQGLRALGLAADVEVCSDTTVAFHDAFGPAPGILLAAGTGSMALGRSADGREARSGGWGAPLSDEGSGWWLGLEAARSVVRAADGRGPDTDLTRRLLDTLALSAVEDLIGWFERSTKREVAALAPAVLDAAVAGDEVARQVVAAATRELARAVTAVLRALEPWPSPPVTVVAGGLMVSGSLLRTSVEEALTALPVRFESREVIPVRGAARRALER